MIFSLFKRVVVKIGDERHVYDNSHLMFTEVAEIEKVTGLSYGEWERELFRYSITAVAALVHVLRKRAKQPSDFLSMQFNARDLQVVPIHDDGTEYTTEEIGAELAARMNKAKDEPDPTIAAAVAAVEAEQAAAASQPDTSSTSPSSPSSSQSAPGSGTGSRGRSSAGSRSGPTRS